MRSSDDEETFAMIKPDVFRRGDAAEVVGDILTRVVRSGLRIVGFGHVTLTYRFLEDLYGEHRHRPFFGDMVADMSGMPACLMLLRAPGAINRWRGMLGPADSRAAERGTLRGDYGDKSGIIYRNVAHGSDSIEAAEREVRLFWELLGPNRL